VSWPIIAAALGLAVLLLLILRWHWHAFPALLAVSIGLGLAAGMTPEAVVRSFSKGLGEMLAGVALLLALGAMLGRLLDRSGAAGVIAGRLLGAVGTAHAPLGVLIASYVLGIGLLFNVGFLLLMPILYRLQQQTRASLLSYLLPMVFGLSLTHSLVPPHPGIVATVQVFGGEQANRVMIESILGGTLLGIPMALVGWYGPGRYWARRQMVEPPAEHLAAAKPATAAEANTLGLGMALTLVILPLALCFLGFGAGLLRDLDRLPAWLTRTYFQKGELPASLSIVTHRPLDWFLFVGNPAVALAITLVVGLVTLGHRLGWRGVRANQIAADGLQDVGSMVFLFGAAGGFKQVIQDSGAGEALASLFSTLPITPVMLAFAAGVVMRAALGSATAAHATTSALLAALALRTPDRASLLVMAVSVGVTFLTQPADSGFWLIKEYGNLSAKDVMVRFNSCRMVMALTGLAILLACERWWFS
jgi:gluconate transporter